MKKRMDFEDRRTYQTWTTQISVEKSRNHLEVTKFMFYTTHTLEISQDRYMKTTSHNNLALHRPSLAFFRDQRSELRSEQAKSVSLV